MGFSPIRTEEEYSFQEDHRWLRSSLGFNYARPVTLNGAAFDAAFPTGLVPSSVVLSLDPETNLYVPYSGVTDDVQTLTIDATGGTYTLTFDGDTTGAIAFDATAAAVEAALEALDSIGDGNVTVSGDAGGPYTITFVGDLADENVAAITTDDAALTGGAGTATIAETEAGGAADDLPAEGLLLTTQTVRRGTQVQSVTNVTAPLLWHGEVIRDFMAANSGLTPDAEADMPHISFVDAHPLA